MTKTTTKDDNDGCMGEHLKLNNDNNQKPTILLHDSFSKEAMSRFQKRQQLLGSISPNREAQPSSDGTRIKGT